MNLDFQQPTGIYIVAVSGGVDSVVLLHVLHKQFPRNTYIVAHVNHGIREDAMKDQDLVEALANTYNMEFECTSLQLGKGASEADARAKRYDFLRALKTKYEARAIITAHHQDDAIETLFINIIRGTGRRGVASLRSTSEILRPMLHFTKDEVYSYANLHELAWHEDSTNIDKSYLRNKVRHDVVGKMTSEQRAHAVALIQRTVELNRDIDKELSIVMRKGLHKGTPVVNRRWFNQLAHDIATEIVHTLLRQVGSKDIDKKSVEKAVVAIKTMQPGKTLQLSGVDVLFTKRSARFISRGKTDEKPV